ncbi:single-stranded DNA-binding protein [Streptomyces sp. NPDC047981]|uniref:single-stranded DNA-binding protein n=1 Tax=Streptomyces sp. NPDC047981 TaxID=3154610 RepID=UPI0034294370
MNDTMVTLVGNVATSVEYRDTATGGVARFRFAVTARRWDRERGTWSDGHTSFYTVFAWRALGANLAASVSVGEPLIVHGRLRVREEEFASGPGEDGAAGPEVRRRTFVDIDAVAVGHDLTRGTAAFRRAVKAEPRTTERQGNGAGGAVERDLWEAPDPSKAAARAAQVLEPAR